MQPDPRSRRRRHPLLAVAARDRVEEAFARLDDDVDLVLLAGDLTTHGEPEQAAVLAGGRPGRPRPDRGRPRKPRLALEPPGRDRASARRGGGHGARAQLGGASTCAARASASSGRRASSAASRTRSSPTSASRELRRVYATTTRGGAALEQGLDAVRDCPVRIVLLHYAPTQTTLEGEPKTIWTFLGTDRMAPPIEAHRPDLVLHGHGHAGTFAGVDRRHPGLQRGRAGDQAGLLDLRAERKGDRMSTLPPETTSYWIASTPETSFPSLERRALGRRGRDRCRDRGDHRRDAPEARGQDGRACRVEARAPRRHRLHDGEAHGRPQRHLHAPRAPLRSRRRAPLRRGEPGRGRGGRPDGRRARDRRRPRADAELRLLRVARGRSTSSSRRPTPAAARGSPRPSPARPSCPSRSRAPSSARSRRSSIRASTSSPCSRSVAGDGSHVFERSRVAHVEDEGGACVVRTAGGRCGRAT